MEQYGVLHCTKQEKDIMIIALSGYLNYFKKRLEKIMDEEYSEVVHEKIKLAEKMIEELSMNHKE